MVHKLACVLLLMCMVRVAPIAQAAITCGQVTSSVSSCLPYLRAGGNAPPDCCSGVKYLNSATAATPDRQAVCKCLKTAASSIPGIIYSLASGLPDKCGVSIPYQISPSTDCSTVK